MIPGDLLLRMSIILFAILLAAGLFWWCCFAEQEARMIAEIRERWTNDDWGRDP